MHDYIAFDPSRAKSSVNRALPEPFPIQLDRGEMAGLLTRLPAAISQSLTPQQIDGLYSALRTLHETKHAIDFRVSLPFFRKRYYITLLAGPERRSLARLEREQQLRARRVAIAAAALAWVAVTGAACATIAVLYLTKSAAGIDLLEGRSMLHDLYELLQ